MPIHVTVSETYDLSTQVNKMSLIGIHTPDRELIQKNYPGLCMNTKYCKIVAQDVVIACASMEPADPLQVGTEAGAIAPEDLFNPILYKAVSNAAMSQIEARIHALRENTETPAIIGHQAVVENDEVTTIADEFPVYYALLSNRDGFRAANPQQGLSMKGLIPLVYERLDTVGSWSQQGYDPKFNAIGLNPLTDPDTVGVVSLQYGSMRGNAKPMPRFPTTIITGATPSNPSGIAGTNYQFNGMGDGTPTNEQIQMPPLWPVYTACIIVPPSKLHKLYYRMVVRTHLEFSEVRPVSEITGFYELATQLASDVYYSDYDDLSKRIADIKSTQVDVSNADITKVMEGR